jgi:hypothetical protein
MSQAQDTLKNFFQTGDKPSQDGIQQVHTSLNRRTFLAGTALLALGGATAWNFFNDSKQSSSNNASGSTITTGKSTKDSLVIRNKEYIIDDTKDLSGGTSGLPTSDAVKQFVNNKFTEIAKTLFADKTFYDKLLETISKDTNFLEKITIDNKSLSTTVKNLKEFIISTDSRLETLEKTVETLKNSGGTITSSDQTILVNGSDLKVNPAKLPAPAITDNSITTTKIVDNSITTSKLQDNSITTSKIVDNSITTTKLVDQSVTTTKISDGAVTAIKLDPALLNTINNKIDDGANRSTAGANKAEIYGGVTGTSITMKRLVGGGAVTLTQTADEITVSTPISSGEANTASNIGIGTGIFKQKTGVNLEYKTLIGNTTVSILPTANEVQLGVNQAALSLGSIGGALNLATQTTGTLPGGSLPAHTHIAADVTNFATAAQTAAVQNSLAASTVIAPSATAVNTALAGKQNTITAGNITSPTTGVTVTNGTGATLGPATTIAIQSASTAQPGLLTAADWNTFNSKQNTIVPANVTAASTRVTLGGTPAGAALQPFSIDVNEANLALNNIGGTLGIAKGGTGSTTAVGARASLGTNDAANITTGVLDVSRGGTGLGGVGANGTVLTVVAGVPAWQAASSLSDGDKGDIVVSGSGSVWTIDPASGFHTNNIAGDWRLASSSTATDYTTASLELQPANFVSGLTATAPRLSLHWLGVVASQIGIEATGRIAILDNPGTGYENFVAKAINSTGGITIENNNDLILKGLGTDPGDVVFQTSTGVEKARVYASTLSNDLYLSAGTSPGQQLSVTSSGAIGFSGAYGTSGQVLTSQGTGSAPIWTNQSLVKYVNVGNNNVNNPSNYNGSTGGATSTGSITFTAEELLAGKGYRFKSLIDVATSSPATGAGGGTLTFDVKFGGLTLLSYTLDHQTSPFVGVGATMSIELNCEITLYANNTFYAMGYVDSHLRNRSGYTQAGVNRFAGGSLIRHTTGEPNNSMSRDIPNTVGAFSVSTGAAMFLNITNAASACLYEVNPFYTRIERMN